MLSEEKVLILKGIEKTINAVLQKIDKGNEDFILSLGLDKKQNEILLKALNDFEKKIQILFIKQKKEYLAAIAKFPEYMKKNQKKARRVIKKETVPQILIDNLAEIMDGFIFANEKAYIDKLAALYQAFTDSFFGQIAEICARSVEGSRLGSNMSLTKRATDWLEQHKIKFAQEVNQVTHNAIIKSLKEGLSEGKGANSAGNKLILDVPNYFNQDKIKEKEKKLEVLMDPEKYNTVYHAVEQQQCFEFYRARRIARTEIISAMNAANLEGWRQSKVVGGKEWVCACDKVSREWHKNADGQQVSLEAPFIVGGEKLMHPGDSSMGASAKNVIHCRCTMKSILKYKMRR